MQTGAMKINFDIFSSVSGFGLLLSILQTSIGIRKSAAILQ